MIKLKYAPKFKYQAELDGVVFTRNSDRDYTHAVVDLVDGKPFGTPTFHGSLDLARKASAGRRRQYVPAGTAEVATAVLEVTITNAAKIAAWYAARLWHVVTVQHEDVVCARFATESEAQAYAAQAQASFDRYIEKYPERAHGGCTYAVKHAEVAS